jgi:hypothetical protein
MELHAERMRELGEKVNAVMSVQECGDVIELRCKAFGVSQYQRMRKPWTRDEWVDFFAAGGEWRKFI